MVVDHSRIALAVLAVLASITVLRAAELPSQYQKSKPPAAARHCDIGGSPGMQSANGVCVKVSGYVSVGFTAGRLK